jgi:hypothetical protein
MTYSLSPTITLPLRSQCRLPPVCSRHHGHFTPALSWAKAVPIAQKTSMQFHRHPFVVGFISRSHKWGLVQHGRHGVPEARRNSLSTSDSQNLDAWNAAGKSA